MHVLDPLGTGSARGQAKHARERQDELSTVRFGNSYVTDSKSSGLRSGQVDRSALHFCDHALVTSKHTTRQPEGKNKCRCAVVLLSRPFESASVSTYPTPARFAGHGKKERERQRQREGPTLTRTSSGKRTPEGFKEAKPRQGRTVRRAGGHLFLDVVGAAVPFGWGSCLLRPRQYGRGLVSVRALSRSRGQWDGLFSLSLAFFSDLGKNIRSKVQMGA
ncbi:hypothetical protein J7T55_007842 [Diaporthe amygdali]|uniref:uncharacterized protein n=1 Tax=Phomopsis amygdali TaxID=1214568 RepID=UPI0022FE3D24|nr:uncharacterized protein J7T55_007842 [Diaporthe amygdali]KAJ0114008.1 hypothetical protein J7T55_007842 [Diaporthe amygdali]